MKKLFPLLFSLCMFMSLSVAVQAQTTPRFGRNVGDNYNLGSATHQYYTVSASIDSAKITPDAYETLVRTTAARSANLVFYITSVAKAKFGDKIYATFLADGTARTISFAGNNTTAANLVTAISKRSSITLMFDGTRFVEIARWVQP